MAIIINNSYCLYVFEEIDEITSLLYESGRLVLNIFFYPFPWRMKKPDQNEKTRFQKKRIFFSSYSIRGKNDLLQLIESKLILELFVGFFFSPFSLFYLEYFGRENISTYFTLVKSRVKLNYRLEYLRQNVARN